MTLKPNRDKSIKEREVYNSQAYREENECRERSMDRAEMSETKTQTGNRRHRPTVNSEKLALT